MKRLATLLLSVLLCAGVPPASATVSPPVPTYHFVPYAVQRPPERPDAARTPPSPSPTVSPRPGPSPAVTRPPSRSLPTSYVLTGTASWYANGPGLYAAAGPALRVGKWRGRRVTVSANGHSVIVTLSDWCQCYGARLIDLSSGAFSRIAPLSVGLVRVTVSY